MALLFYIEDNEFWYTFLGYSTTLSFITATLIEIGTLQLKEL